MIGLIHTVRSTASLVQTLMQSSDLIHISPILFVLLYVVNCVHTSHLYQFVCPQQTHHKDGLHVASLPSPPSPVPLCPSHLKFCPLQNI